MKHTLTKLWIMPAKEREGITDSLLIDSNTTIINAGVDDKYDVYLMVQGDICIQWKDQIYRNRASFPDDLVEAIRNRTFYDHPDAYVHNNNWYEVFVYDGSKCLHYDVEDVDISTITRKDARAIVLDALDEALSYIEDAA